MTNYSVLSNMKNISKIATVPTMHSWQLAGEVLKTNKTAVTASKGSYPRILSADDNGLLQIQYSRSLPDSNDVGVYIMYSPRGGCCEQEILRTTPLNKIGDAIEALPNGKVKSLIDKAIAEITR